VLGIDQVAPVATDDPVGFKLIANLSSGLLPTFVSLNTDVCAVDATGVVTWIADLTLPANVALTCDVTIGQEGDANFNALLPVTQRLTAVHITPVAPPNGVIESPTTPTVGTGRTGGTVLAGGDGAKIVASKTKITLNPSARGGYIRPITAVYTIPYFVTVKGVRTAKTQVCSIKFGTLAKMKKTDKLAYKTKTFTTKLLCTANKDVLAYYNAGNQLRISAVVTRDRRWSTTYLAKLGDNGKGAKIYPTKSSFTIKIG
jgi:hypothetical protein